MGYTVNYGHLQGEAKVNAALHDIRSYLGDKVFAEVGALMFDELHAFGLKNIEQIKRVLMMFAGIEGYPVEAWIQHTWDRVQDYEGKI